MSRNEGGQEKGQPPVDGATNLWPRPPMSEDNRKREHLSAKPLVVLVRAIKAGSETLIRATFQIGHLGLVERKQHHEACDQIASPELADEAGENEFESAHCEGDACQLPNDRSSATWPARRGD